MSELMDQLDVDANEEIVTAEDADVDIEDLDDIEDDTDDTDEDDSSQGSNGVIAELIDIREPLVNLKTALEKRLRVDLRDYDFWLQDSQPLPEETSLVDQCVQGEGIVQINVEIKEDGEDKKINIIDVLKPAEENNADGVGLGSPLRLEMGLNFMVLK